MQALQALAQVAALRRAGHCVEVADQFQRGLLGLWNAAPISLGPERLRFLQQRRQTRREVGVVAPFDGFDECRLPMPTVIQPATVLFAQRMGPLQDALSLRGIQAAGPVLDAFLHAFGAFANLPRQFRLDEFFLQLLLFFCERLLQSMHLALVEAAEQFAGRGADAHGYRLDGLVHFSLVGAQRRDLDSVFVDLALQRLQPFEIDRQLATAVPGLMLAQLCLETRLLGAVHVQVVVQRPGNQDVQVAVGEVDAAAGTQQQQCRDRQQQ